MSIIPSIIRRQILSQVLLATIPVLICGLLIVVHLLQGSFHSIIDLNDQLQDLFQKDIISLENEVIRLKDLGYANAAKLEQYKIDNNKHKQQIELYKEGLSTMEAVIGGAVPLSQQIIIQFERENLPPSTVLKKLMNIYGQMAYEIFFWELDDKLLVRAKKGGFSSDFGDYVVDAVKTGTPDWFEDELGNKDIVVSLVPYKNGTINAGVFALIFDISKAYSVLETADRLSLSIKSAKIQEQRLLEGAKSTKHFKQRRQEQRELVKNNAKNNQTIITKDKNDLIIFIGGNMTVLIFLSIVLFWWLGIRRITCLRDRMLALTESNYMINPLRPAETCNVFTGFSPPPTDQKTLPPRQSSPAIDDSSYQDEIGELNKSINYMLKSLDRTKVSKNLLVQENEERKLVEKKLRENQQRLKTIFDSVQAGIIIIDTKTHVIVDANPAAQKMLGTTTRKVVGRVCYKSICLRKKQNCLMNIPGNSVDNEEHTLHTLEGNNLPAIKTETAITLDGKEHFICSFVDISALQQARNDLEEAKHNAEAANKTKSQFLANMSHEIRTPLNGVIGMASIALETDLTEEQENIIDIISSEAGSLLRIINDILDFSKIEAGKLEMEEIDFDLYSLCEDVVKTIIFKGEEKGIEIIFYIAPDLPTYLRGDPGRIRQVLMNLCGNALKFTNEGEIFIKVELAKEPASADHISFSIKDTGIGIAETKLAYIFESFRQADGSTTRTYGGTGLGTTISKQLVELMGGEIGANSREGKGSTFWFTLPLNESESQEGTNETKINDTNLSGKRVLIVDDNQTNLFILEEYFNSWGCIPIKATNGLEGLTLFNKSKNSVAPIDLILTDLNMPIMNGFTFASRLRETEGEGQNTPIVVLSSTNAIEDKNDWNSLHIQGYTNKPILRQDLKMTACHALGVDAIEQEQVISSHKTPSTSIQNTSEKKFRILLAEDYPTNRKVASHYLSSAGYDVDEAENGIQALDLFNERKYDLVFMDIQMPIMDGYTATAKIREKEQEMGKDSGIPIIAMTAHALNGYREQCIEAGMDDYITKPLRRNIFINIANKWLAPSLPPIIESSKNSTLPASEQKNSPSPVNITQLLDEMRGDKKIVIELFEDFSKSLKQQQSTSRQALETHDLQQLQNDSHSIKGAALNIFANDLAAAAKELEEACEVENIHSIQNMFVAFEEKTKEALAYMDGFIRDQPNDSSL